jgi:hypothetical protein
MDFLCTPNLSEAIHVQLLAMGKTDRKKGFWKRLWISLFNGLYFQIDQTDLDFEIAIEIQDQI